jgi:uncharacterized membrane protein
VEVLLILIALAIPVCAIAAFMMALGLRGRALLLEQRLAALEAQFGPLATPLASPQAPEAPPPMPVAEPTAPKATLPGTDEVAPPPQVPPPSPHLPPPHVPTPDLAPAVGPLPPSVGLDEQLGSRWAVWVGGVALALGGLFLVRYSIEQGLLGPGARTAFGALFAAALVAAGEWLRRTEGAPALPGLASAHVPSVLTAAGTSTAFATVYAAYALYGLIGPGGAFVLLGAIGVATMFAAALHGPALAAFGLVASLATPMLIETQNPNAWALVIYLAFVAFAAYGLARLRLWRWLALAAATGAIVWTIALAFDAPPAMAHLLIQTVLAAAFLVADPHRRTPDHAATLDGFAAGVLGAFALLTVVVAANPSSGTGRPVFATLEAALLLGLAIRFAPAAAGAAAAALVGVGTLVVWPLASQVHGQPATVFPDLLGGSPRPDAVEIYLAFAGLLPLGIAAASLWRLSRGRELPLSTAAWFAGAATVGPLLALGLAYWRVTALDRSVSFAFVAGALAILFVAAAAWLRGQEDERLDGVRLGVGATAAAAVAALAAGLTFALDKGMLTVAFALAALGTAWVADRVRIAPLRYVVAAIGILVVGRLAWHPTLVGGDPGGGFIVNWLLWGYGVPAVAFFLASRLLERHERDTVARFVESLSIVFAALLVFFEIRHALHGGNPLADTTDHLEMGLFATEALAFALLMVRAERRRADIVYDTASLAFGAASAAAVVTLAVTTNPLFTGEPVLGGPVFNSLLPAYLLPAVLATALALAARRSRPRWYVVGAASAALALHLLWTVTEIRRLVHGAVIEWGLATGQGEQWSYSLALLGIGTALLAVGFVWNIRFARSASAAYIVAAVVKVFLFDLANLEGVMRALSFIGLGLVLVAIGVAYQRLLARRQPLAPEPAE